MICAKSPTGVPRASSHSGFLMKVYNVAAGNKAGEDLQTGHEGGPQITRGTAINMQRY